MKLLYAIVGMICFIMSIFIGIIDYDNSDRWFYLILGWMMCVEFDLQEIKEKNKG